MLGHHRLNPITMSESSSKILETIPKEQLDLTGPVLKNIVECLRRINCQVHMVVRLDLADQEEISLMLTPRRHSSHLTLDRVAGTLDTIQKESQCSINIANSWPGGQKKEAIMINVQRKTAEIQQESAEQHLECPDDLKQYMKALETQYKNRGVLMITDGKGDRNSYEQSLKSNPHPIEWQTIRRE